MHSITIKATILADMLAVHKAAHDKERRRPTLQCLSVQLTDAGILRWSATDGKFLASHELRTETTPAGTWDLCVPPGAVKQLAPFAKHTTKHDPTISLSYDQEDCTLTVSLAGRQAVLSCADAIFPNILNAFDNNHNGSATRLGVNPVHLAALGALYDGALVFEFGRGILVTPLNEPDDGIRRRALVMPIRLP